MKDEHDALDVFVKACRDFKKGVGSKLTATDEKMLIRVVSNVNGRVNQLNLFKVENYEQGKK